MAFSGWQYQAINPAYSPAFELGLNHTTNENFKTFVNWLHLATTDSASKQASQSTALHNVEFVAPVYEMSPPVFGIKKVNATVNFGFDSILLNTGKLIEPISNLHVNFFGGLNLLRIKQTLTIIFSDYAGSPATDYSYETRPDPYFSAQSKTTSTYSGIGPDLGLEIQYKQANGLGVIGSFLGTLTVGSISTSDAFKATSRRLNVINASPSHQALTAPNATQVVPGVDSKLGLFYHCYSGKIPTLTLEIGYRIATYLNAISTITPNTLVQPGTFAETPELATGTMALVSTDARSRPFSFNGPYFNLNVLMD